MQLNERNGGGSLFQQHHLLCRMEIAAFFNRPVISGGFDMYGWLRMRDGRMLFGC